MKNILFSLENLYSDDRSTLLGKHLNLGLFILLLKQDPETFRGCPSPSQKIDIDK